MDRLIILVGRLYKSVAFELRAGEEMSRIYAEG